MALPWETPTNDDNGCSNKGCAIALIAYLLYLLLQMSFF